MGESSAPEAVASSSISSEKVNKSKSGKSSSSKTKTASTQPQPAAAKPKSKFKGETSDMNGHVFQTIEESKDPSQYGKTVTLWRDMRTKHTI